MTANTRPIPLEPFPPGEFTVTLAGRLSLRDDFFLLFADEAGRGFVVRDPGLESLRQPFIERVLTVAADAGRMPAYYLAAAPSDPFFPLPMDATSGYTDDALRRILAELAKACTRDPRFPYPARLPETPADITGATDAADIPIAEAAAEAQRFIEAGGIAHQSFTCACCGHWQIMSDPCVFYGAGICEKCGHTTDLMVTGCGFVGFACPASLEPTSRQHRRAEERRKRKMH